VREAIFKVFASLCGLFIINGMFYLCKVYFGYLMGVIQSLEGVYIGGRGYDERG